MSHPIQPPVVLKSSSSRRRVRLRGKRGGGGSEPSLPSLDESQAEGTAVPVQDKIFGGGGDRYAFFTKKPSSFSSTSSSASRSNRSRRTVSTNSTSSSLFSLDDEDNSSSLRTSDGLQIQPKKKSCMRVRTQEESLAQVYRASFQTTENQEEVTITTKTVEEDAKTSPLHDAQEGERERSTSSSRLSKSTSGATINDTTNITHKTKTVVSFSQVTVHRHLITLGDNPSPTEGPPITIDWTALESRTHDFDAYEQTKPEPRPQNQLKLSRILREGWLLSLGVSRRSMLAVEKEVQRIQLRRMVDATEYFAETNPRAAACFQPHPASSSFSSNSSSSNRFQKGARKFFAALNL